jgi:hypothetical protein
MSSGRRPFSITQRFQTMVSRSLANGRMMRLPLRSPTVAMLGEVMIEYGYLVTTPPISTALPPLAMARIAVSKVEEATSNEPPTSCWTVLATLPV